MKIHKTTQVNFGSNKAILENLALALRESHCIALRELPGFERETETKLASLRTCLNQITNDKSFASFLDSFKKHLKKPIELKHNSKRQSLITVASHTEHFGEEHETKIRTNGLDIFEREFLAEAREKFSHSSGHIITKIHNFIKALKDANEQIKPF